jgi:sugar lactone lactonase YvrE
MIGDGIPATDAILGTPTEVVVDSHDSVFFVDLDDHRVRKVEVSTGIITTVAGNGTSSFCGDSGPATSACLSFPEGIALDTNGNLFIADQGNSVVRRVDALTGIITSVAGTPGSFAYGGDGGPATNAFLKFPTDVAVDIAGNIYIADNSNHRIRKVDGATGIITTVAGNGVATFCGDGDPATAACLRSPVGVTVDAARNLFVADTSNHRIRRVDATSGIIQTLAGTGVAGFAGDGGPAIGADLDDPFGVTLDHFGNLFITDTDNNRIRRVSLGLPDNMAPLISNLQAAPNPAAVGTSIIASAKASDSTTGSSTIGSAEYRIDGGSFSLATPMDSGFDEVEEDVIAFISPFSSAGVHEICYRATDAVGNVSSPTCLLIAIYDPNGGFVTGGGWIDSPQGAYTPIPSLIGKANFGFVSKYKKGATTPTGQTEFQFQIANLNFRSSSYEWLVIAGARAKFKGTGIINGSGDYGFLLTAIDGQKPAGGGQDKFRIKIYDKNTDAILYDNQMGKDDLGNDATALRGGSIIIHSDN